MTYLDTPTSAIEGYTPPHPPTPEQQAIIDAAVSTSDNLLISALAGAAKTSTLVMVANQSDMTSIPTLCLAFNKKIAEEMRTRLPSNCISLTLNALGHKVWSQSIGRRCRVSTKKNYDILREVLDKAPKNQRDELYASLSELIRILGHGKSQGWVPDSCTKPNTRLLSDDEFFSSLDEALDPAAERIIIEAMNKSIALSYVGNIDFDDQIFMSTCFPARFPSYPLTMIDESQDLSALNHAMLEQIVRTDRLIAVGDPCQAVYAFRGAYGDSMERLRHKFSMRELTLSTSFRCPSAVVAEAQWRAPNMTAPDWAKEGTVRTLADWSVNDLPQDAVILCRNNAPIYKMAITLLSEDRYPQVVGNDIGKTLIKAMQKLGSGDMPQAEAFSALDDYRIKRLSRARDHAKGGVEDFCACLRIFIGRAETLGGAILYAEHLMSTTGPIKMMTGHKSKGLEFPNVFILDRGLLRINEEDSAKNQDRNLLYVMQTRAQENLTYVTSERFVPSEPDTEKGD